MKSNKGFTLIELLAVIVILAIIALIATPVILNVVEDARRGAAKSSILGYIDAVEKQAMINEMDSQYPVIPSNVDEKGTKGEAYKVSVLKGTYGVTVKGEEPDETSEIYIKDGQVTSDSKFVTSKKKYDVTYKNDEWTVETHKATTAETPAQP